MYHDPDLDILNTLSNDELEPIVKLITEKGTLSELLTCNDKYKAHYPDHKKYLDLIKDELADMGGNSFANIFRGHGVSYREMLIDVSDKLKVSYNKQAPIERIEQCLLEKVLEDAWEKMSQKEKDELLKNLGDTTKFFTSMSSGVLISLFRAGGFTSYKLSLIIANAVCKAILGRGLSLALNAGLVRSLSVLAGPIGIALSGLWMAIDLAGPAYRVTVPAVVYIAALRNAQLHKEW